VIVNGQVQCQNGKSFERALCECDKFVSICFRQSRSTYNPANRRLRGFNRHCKNRNIITNMDTLWTNYLYPECITDDENDFCCGNQSYNTTNAVCCNGKILKSKDGVCCGDDLIDFRTQGCCNRTSYYLSEKNL